MAPTRPSRTGEHGFTLTELLVVLAVIGLLLAASPLLLRSALPGMRSKAAADEVANDLRTARALAISRSVPVFVRFDNIRQIYFASDGRAVHLRDARFAIPNGHSTIEFFPDGSATAAVVIVGDTAARHRVSTEWPTGRVTGR